jgi:hypothetical protein
MHSFLLLSAHRFVPRTNKITFLQTIFSIWVNILENLSRSRFRFFHT